MIRRPWWENLILDSWKRRSIVWLSGVRRSGKTMLCQSLAGARYYDCELPSVRRELADPEAFLRSVSSGPIALDEIHRLDDPSLVLKIASDHFPELRVIATGSSTLGASSKFKDTLAGRKVDVRLTPLCEADNLFPCSVDRARRFLRGGLPGFFLSEPRDDRDYSEWMESFWARDILELFRLERRSPFLKFAELLLAQSGGRFESSSFASACGVSRPTIQNYLAVLEATSLVHVVRPYHGDAAAEIVATPVVYGFDTGFVAWAQGLHEIVDKDRGFFWEHLVVNELAARLQTRDILHWRNKAGREVDFVIAPRGSSPIAIEAKWKAESFEPVGMLAFRKLHPEGKNYVVTSDAAGVYTRDIAGLSITFCPLGELAGELTLTGASAS
jgi:uncharacterized protein